MALTIVKSDNASLGDKVIAGGYVALEGTGTGGTLALATGGALLTCSAIAPCASVAETALGIGTAACADGDCSNELNIAAKLGGKAVEGVSDLNKILSQLTSRGKADFLGIKSGGISGD